MTLTRSQRGIAPRKSEHPGYVETPTTRRRTRPRQSNAPSGRNAEVEEVPEDRVEVQIPARQINETTKIQGWANEEAAKELQRIPKHLEFGGSIGTSTMIIGFPVLMYYMWIGATYYDGKWPWPAHDEDLGGFFRHLGRLVYNGAFPTLKAWRLYWTFLTVQGLFYIFMPGITIKGRPLPHLNGKQLDYYCSAMWSFYSTTVLAALLHVTGIFKLYAILEEFGPIMSVAILSGFLVSTYCYISALARGAQMRMTGYPIYDFFMGAELNPRLFDILDFKMFFEVRLPWYILFLLSCAAAARQYEQLGYVSGEMGFLVMAHWIYANACSKAEQSIVPTWDMYYEKFGFMLCFWNMAGVPLSYCHCTLYLANHHPSEYRWNRVFLTTLYVSYLFVYWVWDTCNSQKNNFRAMERGTYVNRQTFPQLPWQVVENPKIIKTDTGDSLLCDGWYGHARKIHYTCDLFFALSWGLVCGFKSPFPWFYPLFFFAMIMHRASRDIERCSVKYGKAWKEYERRVPYLFIPAFAPDCLWWGLAVTGPPVQLGDMTERAQNKFSYAYFTLQLQAPNQFPIMLVEESYRDVSTSADGSSSMRIFLFHPSVTNYPKARFPGVVAFSEIYQVTGPVERFCRQIAGHGYIVAAPSSYHEFTGPEALEYDGPGTDMGNEWKIKKKVTAYDEDAQLSVTTLLSLPTCTGRIGATGMCLGGHLAYRCAVDRRVHAAVCYFATDLHNHGLGLGKRDDSLQRAKEIKGELVMIFGKKDNHVPPDGRDLIRKTLHDAGVTFSFYEVAWAQHAFIRDELSKGRYDPALTKICFEMLLELFNRVLKTDLGPRAGTEQEVEDIC